MQILNLVQGSEEWKAERLLSFTASEAPIMMGASPYMSRDELLEYKTTGDEQKISRYQQIIFDKGHASEASARPLAEVRCFDGDELFPVTGLEIVEGMRMLASYDGLIMPMQQQSWEHKQLNKELYELVQSGGELEPKHYWQLEHQAIVANLEQVVFTVSDGTDNNKADLVYTPRPERREKLIAHWKQFAIDLNGYVVLEAEKPKPVAEPVPALPSIRYEIDFTKGITIHSNMDVFKAAAQELVKMSECDLVTDQDFENAKARIRECEKAEKNIDSLIERVLGDLGDANKFKLDMEAIKEWIRKSRLNQSNKVDTRNTERKREIIKDGELAVSAFMSELNAKLKPIVLPVIKTDFVAAVKGKSKFENMISSVNNEVARFKVDATALFEKISENLKLIDESVGEYLFLFADKQQLCVKDPEYIQAIASQRIADYKKEQDRIAEQARLAAERTESERLEKLRVAEANRLADAAKAASPAPQTIPAIQQALTNIPVDPIPVAQHFEESFEKVFGADAYSEYEEQLSQTQPIAKVAQIEQPQNDFQLGFSAGLDLALRIYAKHGALGFEKAVKDFIEVGVPPEMSKAA